MVLYGSTLVRLDVLQTVDGPSLDALVYEAADGVGDVGVVHLHGKGSSFLGGPGRFVPPRLPGVTHLALNMRFRDLAYTRTEVPSDDFTVGEVPVGGGCWEAIAEGHHDVAAAVAHLRAMGVRKVVVAGHSSGGFYTADYGPRDEDLAGRIFISPLTGNRTALPVWFPEGAQLQAALDQATAMVEEGSGHHLIPLPTWYYAISARSLLERAAEPEGVWLDAVNRSDSPVLMVWGGDESRDGLWRTLFNSMTVRQREMAVIPGAEHHFVGFEDALAQTIGRFIEQL